MRIIWISHTIFLSLNWVNIVKVLVQIFRFKFTFPGIFFHIFSAGIAEELIF